MSGLLLFVIDNCNDSLVIDSKFFYFMRVPTLFNHFNWNLQMSNIGTRPLLFPTLVYKIDVCHVLIVYKQLNIKVCCTCFQYFTLLYKFALCSRNILVRPPQVLNRWWFLLAFQDFQLESKEPNYSSKNNSQVMTSLTSSVGMFQSFSSSSTLMWKVREMKHFIEKLKYGFYENDRIWSGLYSMRWSYEGLEEVTILTPRNLEILGISFGNAQWKGTTMIKNGQCEGFE